VADLVGGRVQIMFDAPPSLIAHIRSGKLRVLAAASESRNRLLPEAPTFAELGYPKVSVSLWYGLLAPAGTPAPVIARLNEAIVRILTTDAVKARLATLGLAVAPSTPAELTAIIREGLAVRGELVKAANIQAE
jgi:tripartite-type tricarboxylate transporter receptor subunit TctC